MWNLYIFVSSFLTLQLFYVDLTTAFDQGNCSELISNEVQVFITVSSLASVDANNTIKERQLELNWINIDPEENDLIGLFDVDPTDIATNPLETALTFNYPKRYYKTAVQLPRKVYDEGNLTRMCVGYWVAYIRNDVILASNCLRIEPRWMRDSRNEIGNVSIAELMIPGTHNAGSYHQYQGRSSETVVVRYQMCQDEDIWNQLVFGIRHLDFRLGYYPALNQFWLVHGLVRMVPLSVAIEQVKKFVNLTDEMVVLDFHRFPIGFRNKEIHDQLAAYVTEELGDWLIPRDLGLDATLNELWALDKRIFIFYSDDNYVNHKSLWRGLPQVWANTMDPVALKNYFQKYISQARPSVWAAMAQLTPSLFTAITNPSGGSRVLSDSINRNVTEWFRDLWWTKASAVASDYFHGNNIIEIAINVNKLRKRCKQLLVKI